MCKLFSTTRSSIEVEILPIVDMVPPIIEKLIPKNNITVNEAVIFFHIELKDDLNSFLLDLNIKAVLIIM